MGLLNIVMPMRQLNRMAKLWNSKDKSVITNTK
jgi:hypothetical protein